MIFLYLALLSGFALFFTLYSIKTECKHTHFAQFRSRKMKKCIDCGLEVSIDATNW